MTSSKSSKTVLLPHSLAKVELYSTYLKSYFAVLGNTQFIDHINIFDLFCGEGLYEDGNIGSPLVAIQQANLFLNSSPRYTLYINFYFNDFEKSEIECNISKIDRLRRIISENKNHRNISVNYAELDFASALVQALEIAQNQERSRSLFFIDPYGYKNIQPQFIQQILGNYKSELILFLPISQMYRFIGPAQEKLDKAHEYLRAFLQELFNGEQQCPTSIFDFIALLKEQFKKYLNLSNLFVDTFSIQRNPSSYYCLFLFTRSDIGYEKMLDAKWTIDADLGKGFRLGKQKSFFSNEAFSPYPKILQRYLAEKGEVTNIDLYYFGLENGFLPKHTTSSIEYLGKLGLPITTYSLDDKPAKGYYISSANRSEKFERKIIIKLQNHERYKN